MSQISGLKTATSRRTLPGEPGWWGPAVGLAVAWFAASLVAWWLLDPRTAFFVSVGLALVLASCGGALARWERARRLEAVARLAEKVTALRLDPRTAVDFETIPEFAVLAKALETLASSLKPVPKSVPKAAFTPPGDSGTIGPQPPLTRSGLYESPSGVFEAAGGSKPASQHDLPVTDMVNRLDPERLHWLESSPAEQRFLGWSLTQLRAKSFLEIVHPDDLDRARRQMALALAHGEVHGLVLRIRTAEGKMRAVVMNVGARYGPDMTVRHLRCHLTDVTAKLRAERELKLRTRELTAANERLRATNHELEVLEERYRDLYANAPVMYFSLDNQGRFLECNDTLARTLGFRTDELVGRAYETLLPEARRAEFPARFAEYLRVGSIEVETQWVKADGRVIDVWVRATAVRSPDGPIVHSRSAAQDVTARRALESELEEKNQRLARTIEELSRRNHEMDEFTYVVSHDLQEPLRTLIAFSDFLLRDYGDRLEAQGQEYARHLVAASRRMRGLIHDLLALSRIGRVVSEFTAVDLASVAADLQSDLAELIRSKQGVVHLSGPLPTVWGDRARLGQLLTNLVTNGLKYNTSDRPRVEIGALEGPEPPGDRVTLYVRDNGIGIDPRFHARIFQLFRRLHTREEYEGTGAGLAICEKIAQAHGGRIWVESEPNQGATFFVSLRAVVDAAAAPPRDDG